MICPTTVWMPKRNEVSMFRWHVYPHVYSNFIHSNHSKCSSVVEWMNKMCSSCVVEWINKMCSSHEGIFFSHKNTDFFHLQQHGWIFGHYVKWKFYEQKDIYYSLSLIRKKYVILHNELCNESYMEVLGMRHWVCRGDVCQSMYTKY